MEPKKLSRRDFLRWSALLAGVATLAACAPAKPTELPTVAASAASATTAPEATAASAEPTGTQAAEPTTAPATEAPSLAGEIEYFSYDLGPANKSREEIANAFQAANPGSKVKLTVLPYGDNWNKLAALMAAGTPPDVIYGDFSLLKYALAGQLLDLTEQFNADPVLSKPDLFTMDMRDPIQAKFGTSHLYNLVLGTWVPVLYYNRDIFDAASQSYPDDKWTWEDLRAVAKKLTDPAKQQWGVQFGTTLDTVGWLWWQHQPKDFWAIPQIFPEKTDFNNEVGLDVFSFWYNLGSQDKSAVPFSEMGSFQAYGAAFGAGKAAMVIGGDWDAGWGYRELPFKWGVTYLPTVKKDYRPALNCMVATSTIAAATKQPALAWQFARFMSASTEGQTLIGEGAYETPVLKDVAHSDAVLKPSWGAPGYDVRVKAAELPGPMYCPYPLDMDLWEFPSKHFDPTVQKLSTGEMKPEEAVAYLDKEGTPYFAEMTKNMPPIK